MKNTYRSQIENHFSNRPEREAPTTKTPYLIVPNFPTLGLITSLRFLEWVAENTTGVISLPTGKTPEHFIKWTQCFLNNWESSKSIREENGLFLDVKPNFNGLHFAQIDNFTPSIRIKKTASTVMYANIISKDLSSIHQKHC